MVVRLIKPVYFALMKCFHLEAFEKDLVEWAETWGIGLEFLFFERRFCFGKWHSKMV